MRKKFTRKDVISALVTGLTTGSIAWQVLASLGVSAVAGVPLVALVVAVPVCWLAGVGLGYRLGIWMPFFAEFGKFAAVGFTNFAVDSGITNFLIASSGITAGTQFVMFKAVGFASAFLHSYFWNRYWVFEPTDRASTAEFVKFSGVGALTLLMNVSVATAIVHISPVFGLGPQEWANVGIVAGSASGLLATFIGCRLKVFAKWELPAVASVS